MRFETILYEVNDGIVTITFNRPKVFNAYSEQMSQELVAAVEKIKGEDGARVVILKGGGGQLFGRSRYHDAEFLVKGGG